MGVSGTRASRARPRCLFGFAAAGSRGAGSRPNGSAKGACLRDERRAIFGHAGPGGTCPRRAGRAGARRPGQVEPGSAENVICVRILLFEFVLSLVSYIVTPPDPPEAELEPQSRSAPGTGRAAGDDPNPRRRPVDGHDARTVSCNALFIRTSTSVNL